MENNFNEELPEQFLAPESQEPEAPKTEEPQDNMFGNLSEEEAAMLKALLSKSMFYANNNVLSQEQQKKENKLGYKVVTQNGKPEAMTEKELAKRDLRELSASKSSGRILTGTIIGMHPSSPDSKVATNLAEIKFGCGLYRVYIPDFCLFNYEVQINRTPESQKKVENIISSMIGAEVEFIVRSIDEVSKTVYADRLEALNKIGFANYIKEGKDNLPRIIKGSIVEATVIGVTRRTLVLTAFGADCTLVYRGLTNQNISHVYIDNLKQHFHLGQKVHALVEDVKTEEVTKFNNKYKLTSVELSLKALQKSPYDIYFNDFTEGGKYMATITGFSYNKKGDLNVFVNLAGKLDAICKAPAFGVMPEVGDTRIVMVTEMDAERKRLFGVFIAE